MATISISQLNTATQAKVDDLYEVAVVDENSKTGYASRKLTAAQIATLIAQGVQFSGLSTEAKTIIAAINEAAENGGTEVEANPAGEPTDKLETIGIDGTVYEVGSGSEPVSKTATGNPIHIDDAADAPIVSGEITFEPQQDLHGYTKPWAGGAGKNKLPLTVDGIKALNAAVSWSDNTYTVNGVTFTILTDSDNNVIGIKLNGTNTLGSILTFTLASSDFGDSDFRSDGSAVSSTYKILSGRNDDSANWMRIQYQSSNKSIYVRIADNAAFSNDVITPMILLATETDPTFEPYSNICPIEGYTDCEIEVTGKNLLQNTATTNTIDGVTYTVNSDGSVVASGTANGTAVLQISSKIPINVSFGTVTLSGLEATTNLIWNNVILYDDNDAVVERIVTTGTGQNKYNKTFNLADYPTATKISVSIKRGGASDGVVSGTIYPQLEKGSTATSYEPYQSTRYTIDLDGTRYGGEVNFGTGVCRLTKANITLDGSNDESWNITPSAKVAYIELSPAAKYTQTPISNLFNGVSNTPYQDLNFEEFAFTTNTDYKDYINIKSNVITSASDLASWRTWLSNNNLQICYELATPIELQLTPEQIRTLEGTNNITTNMTGMTMEYITQDYQSLVKLIEQSAGHHYSAQERVVGTYFGKPLYERSYSVSTPATVDTVNQIIAVPENSVVVNIFGMYNNQFPINYYYDTTNYINTWLNNAKTHVVNKTPFNLMLNLPGIVTIQYTKTTD